jgi:hypothetical protein
MAKEPFEFRFGLWERLAVTAFVAGVAGIVVSVAYPLAYPESVISIETWRIVLWISAIILGSSVLFFGCDLGLHIARRFGVKVGTALASIGTILIVVGAIVGLIGAFRIDHPEKKTETGSPLQDVSILADCSNTRLALYVPADGIIMEGFSVENDAASKVKLLPTIFSGKPGDPIRWDLMPSMMGAWKCELTSPQQPIFDADLVLEITIIENIRKPDPSGQMSNYSGMPIGTIRQGISRHKIDATPNVVYFINKSDYFINIEIFRIAAGGLINKYGTHERRNNIPVNALRYMSMGPALPIEH